MEPISFIPGLIGHSRGREECVHDATRTCPSVAHPVQIGVEVRSTFKRYDFAACSEAAERAHISDRSSGEQHS